VAVIATAADPASGAEQESPAAAQPSPTPTSYTIKAIRAFPWYHEEGRFGAQELINGYVALTNVVVNRDGDLEGPTVASLIVVQVAGPTFSDVPNGEVVITARTKRAVLAEKRTLFASIVTRKRDLFLPLLVHGTGCEIVTVTAYVRVAGKKVASAKETIEFHCGE
jgi:hypothetical protein